MQNSGEGNIVNPATSLLHEKVYAIPVLFVIGWRGEPGTQDEPQHTYQGAVTCRLLEDLGIEYAVVGAADARGPAAPGYAEIPAAVSEGICAALVVRRGVLEQEQQAGDQNRYGSDAHRPVFPQAFDPFPKQVSNIMQSHYYTSSSSQSSGS